MTKSRPVPLCTELLPSGKLCRGIALRDQRYCHAHIRNHRLRERDRAQIAVLEDLAARVQRMDLPTLLHTLNCRLTGLSRCHAITRFPEVTYLLAHTIDRLEEANPSESDIKSQLTPDQIPDDLSRFSPNEINQMIASLTNSIA